MNADTLLPLVRDTAERADLKTRREGVPSSGVMKLKGEWVVMLEPGIPAAEEVRLLLRGLRKLDLGGIFVPPAVREALDAPDAD